MLFFLNLATALLALGSTAAPTATVESRDDNERVSQDRLNDVRNTYNGIHWDDAAKECPTWKFEVLVESTRMGMELAKWRGDPNGYNTHFVFSPGFNRYFVSSNQWDQEGRAVHQNILSNIHQLGLFAKIGPTKPNKQKQQYRITYSCDDAISRCQKPGVAAYTQCIDGCTTTFCPRFFSQSYLNSFVDYQTVNDMENLISREHSMVHEWLHSGIIGTRPQSIIDVSDTINGVADTAAYGPYLCRDWAWSKVTGSKREINIDTHRNADNYAMALTNNWFDLHFGWNDKGDMPIIPPRKRADGLPTLTPADTTSVTKLNSTPVTQGTVDNCLSDVCNYIGDSYSEYVTGAAVETLVDMFGVLPYKSKGGCELTAKCHKAFGEAIDPGCLCTCDGKPELLSNPSCAGFAGNLPLPHHSNGGP